MMVTLLLPMTLATTTCQLEVQSMKLGFLFFPDLSFSQMVDSLLWGCSSSCNYGGQVPEKPTEETVSQMSFKVPLKSAPVLAARTIKDVTWITCIMCSPFFVGKSFEDCKSKNVFLEIITNISSGTAFA